MVRRQECQEQNSASTRESNNSKAGRTINCAEGAKASDVKAVIATKMQFRSLSKITATFGEQLYGMIEDSRNHTTTAKRRTQLQNSSEEPWT